MANLTNSPRKIHHIRPAVVLFCLVESPIKQKNISSKVGWGRLCQIHDTQLRNHLTSSNPRKPLWLPSSVRRVFSKEIILRSLDRRKQMTCQEKCMIGGPYSTNPNTALLWGKCFNVTIHLDCLIPPKMGNLTTPDHGNHAQQLPIAQLHLM